MRTITILIALSISSCGLVLAQEKAFDLPGWLPGTVTGAVSNYITAPESTQTRRIHAEDIEQESIRMVRFATNTFGVRWTYTEAGARTMLAFNEAHEGQKTRVMIGGYVSPVTQWTFQPMPPLFTTYTQWKEGWLKHRGDGVVGVTEADAKKIMDGLKRK